MDHVILLLIVGLVEGRVPAARGVRQARLRERGMWSGSVVIVSPELNLVFGFLLGRRQRLVEAFVPELTVRCRRSPWASLAGWSAA